MKIRTPSSSQLRTLSLVLAVCGAGCGDDDGGGSLGIALDDARASVADLCDVTRRCYPELQEEEDGYCAYPDEGGTTAFSSDWFPVAAESCWDPIYKAHSEAVNTYLKCLIEANKSFGSCLSSCPAEEAGSADCAAENNDTIDDCEDSLVDAVGEPALEDYEICEKGKRPPDEEDL